MNETNHPIKQTNGKTLFPLLATYCMGVFNDNFFKQTVLLLAASAGLMGIQGRATLFFALPFMLFSAWAGWFADHYPKREIVIFSKFFELVAMLLGCFVLYHSNWGLMVAVVFIMSFQSTFFSPALNGSIPEYFDARDVPRVNSLVKLTTTIFILLGIACAGFILDIPSPDALLKYLSSIGDRPLGRTVCGLFAVAVSIIGVLTALYMKRAQVNRAASKHPFPWLGPINSVLHAAEYLKKDKELFLVLFFEAYFYTVSSAAVLCINNLGLRQMGFSFSLTSLLSVALMVGVGAGALKAGRLPAESFRRLFTPMGMFIGLGLIAANLAALLPKGWALSYLLILFAAVGIAGGMYLIPLMSYIQIKPKSEEKGRVLGVSNFFAFTGILVVGALFGLIPKDASGAFFIPSVLMGFCGVITILLMLLGKNLMRAVDGIPMSAYTPTLLGYTVLCFLGLRYKVSVKGLDSLAGKPNRSLLILPNHPALIDPVLICALLRGLRIRPLADKNRMDFSLGNIAKKLVNPVLLPDMELDGRKGIKEALKAIDEVEKALKEGDNILLYPTGKLRRGESESLGANSALHRLLKAAPETRPVLVRITGLWGSSFSTAHTDGRTPSFMAAFLTGLFKLLVNGLFFMPKRAVDVEFFEPSDFPKTAGKKELNEWLSGFYNAHSESLSRPSSYFWRQK